MKLKSSRRGSVLILTLTVMVILMMYASALIFRNIGTLHAVRFSTDDLRARQAAQAGLNHLLNILLYRPHYGTGGEVLDFILEDPDVKYRISFDVSDPDGYYSVNNLANPIVSSVNNFEGRAVQGRTADVVVTGISRASSNAPMRRRIHTVLRRSFRSDIAAGSEGRVNLAGDIFLGGMKSTFTPSPIPADLHSNHDSLDGLPAVYMTSGSIVLDANSRITCVGEVSPNLIATSPSPGIAPKALPEYSVKSIVERKQGSDTIPGLMFNSLTGKYYCGYLTLDRQVYLDGSLVINGDLMLYNGSLFVNGDLEILGGIKGCGSVFVSGDIKILGGNSSLITNQVNAAAIFAGGDITLAGINAKEYLDSLAAADPGIKEKYEAFKVKVQAIMDLFQIKEDTGLWDFSVIQATNGHVCHWWSRIHFLDGVDEQVCCPVPAIFDYDEVALICLYEMSWHLSEPENVPVAEEDKFESFFIEPNGMVTVTSKTEALVPALMTEIIDYLGPSYETDPSARKVVSALHDFFYYFRHNHPPSSEDFYDNALPTPERSFPNRVHHVFYPNGDMAQPRYLTGAPRPLTVQHVIDMTKCYLRENNPLDEEWCGDSYFQGIVYSQKDIKVSNRMKVYGTVIAGGELETADTSFIYHAEYMDMNRIFAPLRVLYYRDF